MKRSLIAVSLTLLVAQSQQASADNKDLNLRKYFKESTIEDIKAKTDKWVPYEFGKNPMSKYTDGEIENILGGLHRAFEGTLIEDFINGRSERNSQKPTVKKQKKVEADTSEKPRLKAIPTSFDARTNWPNCIHSVRDQGSCGSCWAFASAGFLEDRFCIASGATITNRLSPQDMVNCDFTNGGCGGGWLSSSLNYLIQNGIVSEACMPYSSDGGLTHYCTFQCDSWSTPYTKYYCKRGSLRMYTNTDDIKTDLMTNGPMMVGFTVYDDFLNYASGIYQYTTGSVAGGHAVKLIGWDVDGSGNNYWICQNQWGTSWGESGYFNIYEGQVGLDSVGFSCLPDVE